jgi:hypothetical protein
LWSADLSPADTVSLPARAALHRDTLWIDL